MLYDIGVIFFSFLKEEYKIRENIYISFSFKYSWVLFFSSSNFYVAHRYRFVTTAQVEDALSGVVLEKGLETRLSRVAQSTFNTKRNNAPFRHLLLYGAW